HVVGQMAGWLPHQSLEESQRILDHFIEGKHCFALVEKKSGKVIGSLGLETSLRDELPRELEEQMGREIGYVLSKAYWGQGLMPEAVARVIQYLFEELKLDFVLCGHWVQNDRSRRVIEKSGFHFLQERIFVTRWGEERPSRMYVLVKEEYLQAKANSERR
ncbi:MAG: GNAT family N-acetyltransferase, partial [Lachnospiraceae bacterium]|nr:GNAT family N-acetyltransferase [Lachnospiraceae bacterium]